MQTLNKPISSENNELVLAITYHDVLGYLIEPFAVGRTANKQFEYGFKKVTRETVADYFDPVDSRWLEVFDLLNKISEFNLHKRFNPQSQRINRFYDLLEPEYIGRHIRPFIEKVLYQCVELINTHRIPLYYKGEMGERIRETPLILHDEIAETRFHFERLPDKTLYRLEVKQDELDLNLYLKTPLLITTVPCLLLIGHHLLRFDPEWNGKKLQPFFDKEYLIVPKTAEKQFFQKFVQKGIRKHPFVAVGFDVKEIKGIPQPILKLEEHWQGGVVLALWFWYDKTFSFRCDDPVTEKVNYIDKGDDFAFEKVTRNTVFEKSISNLLRGLNLTKVDGPYYSLFSQAEKALNISQYNVDQQITFTIDWLSTHDELLRQQNFILEKKINNKTYHTGKYSLELKTQEKNDWFDLYGMVRFGSFEVPFAYLADFILADNREYILPDGSIALIPQEWMSRYKDIFLFSQRKGKEIKVRKYHVALLRNLNEKGLTIPSFELDMLKLKNELPDGFIAQLRHYQLEGFNWMMFLKKNGLGGCLADDMGLGKTIQTLALLAKVHQEKEWVAINDQYIKPVLTKDSGQLSLFGENETSVPDFPASLIVMPLSLIHNWIQEISRFAPHLRVNQHTGAGRAADIMLFDSYDIILTTYGTVRNDIDFLEKYRFTYIVLDESQIIKNASSRASAAIRRLQSQHRLVLTGTPVENTLADLWSQFAFINPGMLGSLNFFRKEFVTPIEKKNDVVITHKLQKLVEPFILRRTKSQVAKELPELSEKIHYCEMTTEQEKYYEMRKSEIRNAIVQSLKEKGADNARFFILSGLTKLRLIANHPSIIDPDYKGDSGKFLEVQRSIENLLAEGHKALIFSQFVKHLNLFAVDMSGKGVHYNLLTGKHNSEERKQSIKQFSTNDTNKLFFISLKAGGLGLNLTEADYVFMLDPWWNPAIEAQAINRAHRIGQDKNVFVYKFITRNTVEEKIIKLQQKKSDLAGMFINDNNPLKSLSVEELSGLMD